MTKVRPAIRNGTFCQKRSLQPSLDRESRTSSRRGRRRRHLHRLARLSDRACGCDRVRARSAQPRCVVEDKRRDGQPVPERTRAAAALQERTRGARQQCRARAPWPLAVERLEGASSLGSDARKGLRSHPTVKPTAMLEDALLDLTHRDDLVLDPFLGSGSTLMAAEKARRTCRGVEIDPLYVDVVLRRFEAATGIKALLVTA